MTSDHVSDPITGWGRPALGDDLRLRLLHFGASVIDGTWSHRFSDDPFWRIYRNSGPGAAVICAGVRHELRTGEVWLVPPWLDWRTSCERRVGHVHVHVEVPEWSQEVVRSVFPKPLKVADAALGDALWHLAKELVSDGATAERCWRVIAACASIFAAACATVSVRSRARLLPSMVDPLAELRARIEYDLDGSLHNQNLAHAVGISEPTLVRRFRRVMGTSPARFVAGRRIERAAELLVQSDMPIDAIAARCGFADRHSFSKAFRRAKGTPPATYRRSRGES